MSLQKTGGHYDEMNEIQRLRTEQLNGIRNRMGRRRAQQNTVREESYPNHIQQLKKTTTRKAPAGHH